MSTCTTFVVHQTVNILTDTTMFMIYDHRCHLELGIPSLGQKSCERAVLNLGGIVTLLLRVESTPNSLSFFLFSAESIHPHSDGIQRKSLYPCRHYRYRLSLTATNGHELDHPPTSTTAEYLLFTKTNGKVAAIKNHQEIGFG